MDLRIERLSGDALAAYSTVPIAFAMSSRLVPFAPEGQRFGIAFREEPLPEPRIKDYDAMVGEGPANWPHHFNLAHWKLFGVFLDRTLVGGAAVALANDGLELLTRRSDAAILYDLRVHPDCRRQGIGQALFAAAAETAKTKGFRYLEIETQNTNVAACRFYARQGCVLRTIHPDFYPDFPDEILLVWSKTL